MGNKENTNALIDFIDRNFSAHQDIQIFYHYTTLEALVNGIIVEHPEEGKEICMRATQCRYMNDPNEIKEGLDVIFPSLVTLNNDSNFIDIGELSYDTLLNIFQNQFVICFSKWANSLPMWRAYSGNGTGVCIGFKRFKSLSDNDLVLKCIYSKTILKKRLLELSDNTPKILFKVLYALSPYICKNIAYRFEDEIRLIGSFTDQTTKYRYKKGLILPYKDVYFSKDQISTIAIGPSANQAQVEESLRYFLNDRGLNNIEIKRSPIPYRDF